MEKAKELLSAKLTCMELDELANIEKGCERNCYSCKYMYEQGTAEDQKEAIRFAISAIEKQIPKKPIENSCEEKIIYKCTCRRVLRTKWSDGTVFGAKIKYCSVCGQALLWEDE